VLHARLRRGEAAPSALKLFLLFIIPAPTMVNKPSEGYLNMLVQLFHVVS
jgi:hypothetical protein